MTVAEQVHAIRHSVAMSLLDHVTCVRLSGPGAHDLLDRVVAGPLRIRDGQLRHAILLTENATPFADAHVARDDEEFFMLAEGPAAADLIGHLRDHAPADTNTQITDATASHAIVALDGPFAWELLGAAIDPEVIGLPYLTFYHHRELICYRSGKTGEFGYGIIVPREHVAALADRIRELGRAFEMQEATLEALDHCALENWFFNIRREGREPLTPLELQLQWRVGYDRPAVGIEALRRRRADGPTQRVAYLVSADLLAVGADVAVELRTVGRVLNAAYSEARGEWVALALLDRRWAYPGIGGISVQGSTAATARSISPPALMNRSLAVSPQLHSFARRSEIAFPPFARA